MFFISCKGTFIICGQRGKCRGIYVNSKKVDAGGIMVDGSLGIGSTLLIKFLLIYFVVFISYL